MLYIRKLACSAYNIWSSAQKSIMSSSSQRWETLRNSIKTANASDAKSPAEQWRSVSDLVAHVNRKTFDEGIFTWKRNPLKASRITAPSESSAKSSPDMQINVASPAESEYFDIWESGDEAGTPTHAKGRWVLEAVTKSGGSGGKQALALRRRLSERSPGAESPQPVHSRRRQLSFGMGSSPMQSSPLATSRGSIDAKSASPPTPRLGLFAAASGAQRLDRIGAGSPLPSSPRKANVHAVLAGYDPQVQSRTHQVSPLSKTKVSQSSYDWSDDASGAQRTAATTAPCT